MHSGRSPISGRGWTSEQRWAAYRERMQHRGWGPDWEHYAPRPPRLSARARLLIPVVVSLLLQVTPALIWLISHRSNSLPGIATLALAVAGPLLLLAARRFPAAVIVLVAILAGIDLIVADQIPSPPYIALAFAIVGAIVRGARVWAWISVGVSWTATLVVGALLGIDWNPARIAISTLGILVVFGIGEATRARRELYREFARENAQRKQTEVQAERVRIARELHDVLAHSLSQINVQASVGLHLMDKQPEKASEALASIKETSKTALDEVRSVLGVLRAEDGQDPSAPLVPEPDFSRLAGLAASVTSQGVEVSLTNSIPDAPKAVQLATYRIVQEALTNVVRHANATRATVDISIAERTYLIAIADDGRGVANERDLTSGRGLLGMRERAELLGGTLEVTRSPLGGLLVLVAIPQKEHVE